MSFSGLLKHFSTCLILFVSNPVPTSSSPVSETDLQKSILNILRKQSIISNIDVFDALSGIKEFYLPVNTSNEKCNNVVESFSESIKNDGIRSWALKMGDSWGKVPDGIFFGNIHIVGMYEECLEIRGTVNPPNDTEIRFKGKYCKIFYDKLDTNNKLRSGPGIAVLMTPLPFYYATCIPSVCSDEDLMVSLTQKFFTIGREVMLLDCHEEGRSNHTTNFDGFDAFVASLLALLVLFAICGTVIDENNLQRYGKTKGQKLILKKLTCFSVTRSFKSTFRYCQDSEKTITCLHGMRVITLIWIMTCHQFETGLKYVVDAANIKKYEDLYAVQLITDGYQSVDTFFTISGLLLSYRLFPVILEGKNLSAKFFVKGYSVSLFRRIIRLLPSIFVVATFSATILRFLGFGPRSRVLDKYAEKCRDNWWKDPLFVDNLIHDEGEVITQSDCLLHCWYTAVEMQLFLVAPFVFLPRIYDKLSGFIWLAFLTVMSQVIPLIVLLIYEFPPVLFPYLTIQENYDFYSKYYEVPWCRSSPWFIGIWTGIIMVKYPNKLKKITKLQVVIGYIIALGLGVLLVLGLFRYNQINLHPITHAEIPDWLSGLYGFFSRPVWALCVSFVIVTCYTKNAWYVNRLLSWWGWQPLSRLTFTMYLVHPVVQVWWASTLYVPIYISVLTKVIEVTGVFFMSLLFGFLLSAFVEQPILRLTENIASTKALKLSAARQNSRLK